MEKNQEILTFKNEVTDAYFGQLNMLLTAIKNEQPVGQVEYIKYNGEISINHILVLEKFRRKGIATSLLRYLQKKNKDKEIEWGYTTNDGTALKNAITYTIPNEETANKFKELEVLKAEFEKIDEKIEDENLSEEDGEKWNKLYDKIELLKNELWGKSPIKTLINCSNL